MEYRPFTQFLQVTKPRSLPNKPGLHVVHTVFPLASWWVPYGQSLHMDWLVRSWKRPASQAVHSAPPSPGKYLPTLQPLQCTFHVDSMNHTGVLDTFPGAQSLHVLKPSLSCCRPASHSVQAERPVAGAYFPGAQLVQAAAVDADQVPFAHGTQFTCPGDPAYRPGAQL